MGNQPNKPWNDKTDSTADKTIDVRKILEDLDKPPHQHQHIIPVEWKDFTQRNLNDGMGGATQVLSAHSVTKLRCQCGDEVSR